jgi:hypothetical protein
MSMDRRRLVRWTGYLPYLVPVLCVAAAVTLRPSGRLGPPDAAPWIDQLIYDDNDVAAYALRAWNAALGRPAGRYDAPARSGDYARALTEDRTPVDRYYLEYPHAALVLFRIPFLFQPDAPAAPAALLDGAHEDIVSHKPNASQSAVWQRFHKFAVAFMVIVVAVQVALVGVLAVGYQSGGGLSYRGLLLILPGALFFSLNRFDVVPALLTALSFASVGRRWYRAAAVFLAAGALVKVYPLLLAPLVLRYLQSTAPREAGRWSIAFAGTLLAFLGPATLTWDGDQVLAPYLVQLSRPQEGLTAYQYLIPIDGLRDQLAGNGIVGRLFRLGSLGAVMTLMLLRPITELEGVLRRGTVVLVAFISLSVFYSPQWILWLTPLVLPLAGRYPRLVPLLAVLDLATWGQWPVACHLAQVFEVERFTRDALLTVLAFARFAALGLLLRDLLRADRVPSAEMQVRAALA